MKSKCLKNLMIKNYLYIPGTFDFKKKWRILRITKAKIVTANPIIAKVIVDRALSSFLVSPPDVTNLIPEMIMNIIESDPAMPVKTSRMSEAK